MVLKNMDRTKYTSHSYLLSAMHLFFFVFFYTLLTLSFISIFFADTYRKGWFFLLKITYHFTIDYSSLFPQNNG